MVHQAKSQSSTCRHRMQITNCEFSACAKVKGESSRDFHDNLCFPIAELIKKFSQEHNNT